MTEGQVELSLVDAAMSANFMNFYNQVQGIQGSSNVANIANTLSGMYGSQNLVRAKLLEADWARPGWGIAFVPADVTVEEAVNNQGAPSLDLRAYADTTLAFGFGKSVRNTSWGLFSWGMTLKAIEREYVSTQLNALDIAANSNAINNTLSNSATDGFTTDADLGFLYSPYLSENAWDWLRESHPTFALVGHNLLDYGFGTRLLNYNASQTTVPEQLYGVLDVGSSFEIPRFWIFGGRFAVDERDIGHPQYNWHRGLHAGFEFDWTVASWWKGQWRAGYGEGFWSAGFSALFTLFRLDLACYADDIGTYNSPVENRIYDAKVAMEF
jgi:hypothetical protein